MTYAILFLLLTLAEAGKIVHPKDGNSRVKRSDDAITLNSLADTVEQQGTIIQMLQARVTALENRELPSTFQPVAFTVHFSHYDPTGQHGVAIGDHTILQFDAIVTNIGNAYNPQTGIFTAPVPGLYVLFLTVMSSDAHSGVHLAIDKHGQVLDEVYAAGGRDPQDQGSSQVTTHLDAEEQVWVRQVDGDHVRGLWWTVFTGYLLQAE